MVLAFVRHHVRNAATLVHRNRRHRLRLRRLRPCPWPCDGCWPYPLHDQHAGQYRANGCSQFVHAWPCFSSRFAVLASWLPLHAALRLSTPPNPCGMTNAVGASSRVASGRDLARRTTRHSATYGEQTSAVAAKGRPRPPFLRPLGPGPVSPLHLLPSEFHLR